MYTLSEPAQASEEEEGEFGKRSTPNATYDQYKRGGGGVVEVDHVT
jgi:hypothetical protein